MGTPLALERDKSLTFGFATMRTVLLVLVSLICAALWLGLLVVTRFDTLAISAGLVGMLAVTASAQ